MIQYPSLFPDKGSVFNDLFLRIGNGYEWEKGGLVFRAYRDDLGAKPRWADESGEEDRTFDAGPEIEAILKRGRVLSAKQQNNQVRFVLENFDDIYEQPIMALRSAYPACEYSKLFTMPDDVRPDWKVACDLTSRLLHQYMHHQQQKHFRPGELAAKLNREFRQKHFAKKDEEMRKFWRAILPESATK